jgi:hypothetical protein
MALRSRITPDKHGHHSCREGKLFVLEARHCAIFNIGYSRQVQYQIDLIHIYHLLYFENTKGAIRSRKSKKDRQHNGQKKKDKRSNNDLQSTTQKTKDQATRTPLTGDELMYTGRVSSFCSTCDTRRDTARTSSDMEIVLDTCMRKEI